MQPPLPKVCRKVILPLLLSGWMVSCSPLDHFGFAQTYLDIAQLEEIANQRIVNIQGMVVNVAPFLEGGAYQLKDSTGSVWVKTDRPLPKKGEVLSVRGEVAFEAIFIGPEKLGESYIIEIAAPKPEVATTDSSTTDAPAESGGIATIAVDEPDANTTDSPNPPTDETAAVPDNPDNNSLEVTEVSNPAPEETVSSPTNDATASNAAALETDPNPGVVSSPAVSPSGETINPPPTTPPQRPNVDDQFLPHKRLAK